MNMSEKTERYVKPGVPESTDKPSPYRCSECGETVYKHENGKFWCEECGGLKDQVWDLRTKEGAKAESEFRQKKEARAREEERERRMQAREAEARAAQELKDRVRKRREERAGKEGEKGKRP